MDPLPFTDFLELLRDRGFGVGLQDYIAVGKLLDRWERTDRAGLRDAIAALVARNETEVRDIRALFDEHYPEDTGAAEPQPEPGRRSARITAQTLLQRRVAVAAAVTLLASVVALIVAVRIIDNVVLPAPPPAPVSDGALPAITPPRADGAPIDPAVPTATITAPEPVLPSPPSRVWWRPILWTAGGAAMVVAMALWAVRLWSAAREWARRGWRRVLAELPGPFEVPLRLRDLVTRLPKADVEEAATIIGRAFSREGQGRDLDVHATIAATVRAAHPRLVFATRRVQEPVLVLQDVAQTMEPHAAKVNGLLDDLRRQGVLLDRWYYDGDVSRPAPRPFSAPMALEDLLRRRDTAPVMVVSAAEGLHASIETADAAWLDALARLDRRVWVTPVADSRLWPAALHRVPLPVVPMTRRGLVEAASLLAHAERIGTGLATRMVHAERRATAGDVRRLERLASLVPFPTVSTLELLRQRFASDVPEAAVIHAVGGTTLGGDQPFRMPDEKILRLAAEIRRDDPALEARVRAYLLQVLADSEPPAGSAAHGRWQAAAAMHRLQLAQLRGDDPAPARAELERLERGPLWEEVRAAVARQPGTTGASARPGAAPAGEPPPFTPQAGAAPRFVWRWPRPADLAAALVLAALFGALVAFSPVGRRTASHLAGAYHLEYQAGASAAGTLAVRLRSDNEDGRSAPLTIQLYRDGLAFGAPITMDRQVGASVAIDAADTPHVYQARAGLPDGASALSNSVWAPSVLVIVNAQPWARVTITSSDGRVEAAEVTPVAIRLPPGAYTMRFENDGIAQSSTQQVRVAPPGPHLVNAPTDVAALDEAVRRLSGGAEASYATAAGQ